MKTKFYDWNDVQVEKPEDAPSSVRVGVYAVAIHQNRMLFVRSSNTGRLELPGGGLEVGESYEECVIREGVEETGHHLEPLGHPIHLAQPRGFYIPPENRFCWAVSIYYEARITQVPDEDFKLDPGEVAEVVWIDVDTLRQDWHNFVSEKAFAGDCGAIAIALNLAE